MNTWVCVALGASAGTAGIQNFSLQQEEVVVVMLR